MAVVKSLTPLQLANFAGFQGILVSLSDRKIELDLTTAREIQIEGRRTVLIQAKDSGVQLQVFPTPQGVAYALVESGGTEVRVTDLSTLDRVDLKRDGDEFVVQRIVSRVPASVGIGLVPLAAALPQCTGTVPPSLLQARDLAAVARQSALSANAVAIAKVAALSVPVAAACNPASLATAVGVGACAVASIAYFDALNNQREADAAIQTANINLDYAQRAITTWKSDYATSKRCAWY